MEVDRKSKQEKLQCFRCGKFGHVSKECHGQAAKCFKCGQMGHISISCRQDGVKQQTQPQSTVSTNNFKSSLNKGKMVVNPEGSREETHNPSGVITDTVMNHNASTNLEQAKKEYAEFEEKVRRSVLLGNLSPDVTLPVLKMALEQFGTVVTAEFIQNLSIPYDIPQCALVEMEDPGKASKVVRTMRDFPFMISGMPRPVCASLAKAEMFADRPARPGRKINFRWVEKTHPDFEVGERIKKLCSRHTKETLALAQLQLEEEGKLGKQQEEMVVSNYKKYEMIELLLQDGFAAKLAHRYGIVLSED